MSAELRHGLCAEAHEEVFLARRGHSAFRSAVAAEGRAMSMEQAIAYGLDEAGGS
jgi:hypothetical protein